MQKKILLTFKKRFLSQIKNLKQATINIGPKVTNLLNYCFREPGSNSLSGVEQLTRLLMGSTGGGVNTAATGGGVNTARLSNSLDKSSPTTTLLKDSKHNEVL